MGTVYIFRGKAATGKTTLSDMLAEKLSIPVIRKDDVVDALKTSKNIEKSSINNEVCYNILYKIIQTNLDLHADFILDIGLVDRNNAAAFYGRLDFKSNRLIQFFTDCSDGEEWKRRHLERLKNPLPHQSFQSIEHLMEHYKNADIRPFDDEHIIDSANPLEQCFQDICDIADSVISKEGLNMQKTNHPLEKLVQMIPYKGVDFEVVERPDVLWVGCVDYAQNNTDESDIGTTLRRYREELIDVPKHELINPDWSASLSINYGDDSKPCGLMFAQEAYSGEQDRRYDLFTQPGGLWLRISITAKTDLALLGRRSNGAWEYFGVLETAAEENGYKQDPDVHVQVEYQCHAEYGNPTYTSYAYIPVKRK